MADYNKTPIIEESNELLTVYKSKSRAIPQGDEIKA